MRLEREFQFKDFKQAIDFVNAVAEIAEAQNHHPDIAIHSNRVRLSFWTHTTGSVTEKDQLLEKVIRNIYETHFQPNSGRNETP